MILYSSIICFMPRNGSCNFRPRGSWRNTFRTLCSYTDIPALSLFLSQQREGELDSLLLATFCFVSWGKKLSPGMWLLLLELFSFALVQTPAHHHEPSATAQQGGPGMLDPSSGPKEKPSWTLNSTSFLCSQKVQILTNIFSLYPECTLLVKQFFSLSSHKFFSYWWGSTKTCPL